MRRPAARKRRRARAPAAAFRPLPGFVRHALTRITPWVARRKSPGPGAPPSDRAPVAPRRLRSSSAKNALQSAKRLRSARAHRASLRVECERRLAGRGSIRSPVTGDPSRHDRVGAIPSRTAPRRPSARDWLLPFLSSISRRAPGSRGRRPVEVVAGNSHHTSSPGSPMWPPAAGFPGSGPLALFAGRGSG